MTEQGPVPGRRRAAAVVALLAPPAAALVAVSAIDSGGPWALATALSVLVAAASGWLLLTRRGGVRLVGGLGVLVGLVALVGFQFVHWEGTLSFLLILALLAGFGPAGRYALDGPAGDPATPDGRPVGAAAHGVLIVNPRSGDGKAARLDLASRAAERGIRVLTLEPDDDLRALAERAAGQGADVIGIAGGDGSQAIVAEVAMRHGIAHVCVPAGTRNHFALDLGLDRQDVVGALDAFTDGVERRIDLAEMNGRVFVNNASLGVYGLVVQSDSYREAKLQTWARLLPDLLGPEAEPIDLRFTGPDGTPYTDAALVLVSNNPYQVENVVRAGTRPRLDAGVLGLVVARIRGTADIGELHKLAALSQAQHFSGLLRWTAAEFEVDSGAAVPVGLDGEALTMRPPVRFRSLPAALRVRVPRAAGATPAARRAVELTGAGLLALLQVALGRPVPGSHPWRAM